jgi:hypothetical protein
MQSVCVVTVDLYRALHTFLMDCWCQFLMMQLCVHGGTMISHVLPSTGKTVYCRRVLWNSLSVAEMFIVPPALRRQN